MRFPTASAGPAEIREYIVYLLTTKHDTDSEWAVQVANAWVLGRGINFQEATKQQFNELFGYKTGPYLYLTTRMELVEAWKQTPLGISYTYVSAASLALAAYFLVRANRTASWEITCREFSRALLVVAIPQLIYASQGPKELQYLFQFAGVLCVISAIAYVVAVLVAATLAY